MEFIIGDIRERLLQEPDVDEVDLEIVWDPPWTRRRLAARAIENQLRIVLIQSSIVIERFTPGADYFDIKARLFDSFNIFLSYVSYNFTFTRINY